MTLYLVIWDHWQGEHVPLALIKGDLRTGVLKDWGYFAGSGRGYALVNAKEETELVQLMMKYRRFGVRMLSTEPVVTVDQFEKIAPD